MHHCRETPTQINIVSHYDETKSGVNDSQIVILTENLKLCYGGPSQRQASGTNQQIKALRQGRH